MREGSVAMYRESERQEGEFALGGWATPALEAALAAAAAEARFRLEDVEFRCRDEGLILLRPCSRCGTGEIASLPIRSIADLASALMEWRPCCVFCLLEGPSARPQRA